MLEVRIYFHFFQEALGILLAVSKVFASAVSRSLQGLLFQDIPDTFPVLSRHLSGFPVTLAGEPALKKSYMFSNMVIFLLSSSRIIHELPLFSIMLARSFLGKDGRFNLEVSTPVSQ